MTITVDFLKYDICRVFFGGVLKFSQLLFTHLMEYNYLQFSVSSDGVQLSPVFSSIFFLAIYSANWKMKL
jgi:hypothetical protein